MSSNSTAEEVGFRQQPAASSSAGLISVVIVCMTILAVCALVYFAIRCYFDERRWRASALLCKCQPPAAGSFAECGNVCRYVEQRAFNVQDQATCMDAAAATGVANCRTISDVRMSETQRTGAAFSSPLANNEAIPNWRPPATGSSHRHGTNHYYRIQKSSHRPKHRHQRRHYAQEQEECGNYPLRRARPYYTMPSIRIQPPSSSSDSYSNLTMSQKSKVRAMIRRDLTTVSFPRSDEEDNRLLGRHRYNRSGLSEGSSTNLFHPRYNTPVSEIANNNNNEVVVVNVEDGGGTYEEGARSDATHVVCRDERKWPEDRTVGMQGGATSCPSSAVDVGWYIDDLKRCQTTRTASSCGAASAVALPLDMARSALLPLKGTFPSCEILPGGRLITRWTQTDNESVVSRASLDWDNYESERMRTEMDLDLEHRLKDLAIVDDEGVEGMTTSCTTLLMASQESNDTTLQASRISNRSASSPYVLCFECSEEFSVNDERRGDDTSYFAPRHTSSSPRPPRRSRRFPTTPPDAPQMLDPSPTSRHLLHPDGHHDGRSSKAVKPRRK